jgi:hypothetical protein
MAKGQSFEEDARTDHWRKSSHAHYEYHIFHKYHEKISVLLDPFRPAGLMTMSGAPELAIHPALNGAKGLYSDPLRFVNLRVFPREMTFKGARNTHSIALKGLKAGPE